MYQIGGTSGFESGGHRTKVSITFSFRRRRGVGAPDLEITPEMTKAGISVLETSFGGLRDPLLRIEQPD